MSRYKAYREYKDSGVEWLGEIPSQWKLCPLKFMARIKNGQDYKDVEVDEGYPVIGSGGQFSYASRFTYNKESVLLGRKGTIDKPLYINEPFWTVDTMYYTVINQDISPKFLYYLALTIQFSRYSTNTALPSMTQENLGNYIFAIPANERDRRTIAAFLDHETAKIDALIEKQQRLIELLKEKRQAVISHAVTKGLNPNAPMKDSGVEWLGEVPAHWVVGRYKFCTTRIVVGIAEAATHAYADTGIPILRSTNIREEGLDVSGMLFIKPEFANENESKYLYANDIITVRTGYPGISAVIPQDLDKSQCFTNLIGTPNRGMNPYFLAEYLNSHTGRSYFDLLGWGSAQKNISVPILQNIPISHPDTAEQARIVEFVKTQRDKYSKLIENAGKGIELLQERRTALISAAVTGKIDVREWQAASA